MELHSTPLSLDTDLVDEIERAAGSTARPWGDVVQMFADTYGLELLTDDDRYVCGLDDEPWEEDDEEDVAFEADLAALVYQRAGDLLDRLVWSPYSRLWTIDGGETVIFEPSERVGQLEPLKEIVLHDPANPIYTSEGTVPPPDIFIERQAAADASDAYRRVFAQVRAERRRIFRTEWPVEKYQEHAKAIKEWPGVVRKAVADLRSARADRKARFARMNAFETLDEWNGCLGWKSRLVNAARRRRRPKATWAVEKRIPSHGVGQMYGETYTGKSFVMLDLALTIANGLSEFHGAPVNISGPVVVALMEGVFDFQDRIDAWLIAHPGTTDENLYTLEEEEVDLRDKASIGLIEKDCTSVGVAPVLLVVDTQSLATPGTDENSNTDMNLVFGNLKRLSARLRCPVMTVHHTGYDTSRTRGASAQKAALDFQIRIEAGSILFEKVKGFKPSGPFPFRLEESGESVWAAPGEGAPDPERLDQRMLRAVGERPWMLTRHEVLTLVGRSVKADGVFLTLSMGGQIITAKVKRQEGARTYTRDVWAIAGTPLPEPADEA